MGSASSQPVPDFQSASQDTAVPAQDEKSRPQAGSLPSNATAPSLNAVKSTVDVMGRAPPSLASPIRFTKRKRDQGSENAVGDGDEPNAEPRPRKKARARPRDPSLLKPEVSNPSQVQAMDSTGEIASVPPKQKKQNRKSVPSSPTAPELESTSGAAATSKTFKPSGRERNGPQSNVHDGPLSAFSTDSVHQATQARPEASKPATSPEVGVFNARVLVRKPANKRRKESNNDVPPAERRGPEKASAKPTKPRGARIQTPPTSSQGRSNNGSVASPPETGEASAKRNVDNVSSLHGANEQRVPAAVPPSADARLRLATSREPNIDRTARVAMPDPLVDGPTSGTFTDVEKRIADDVCDAVMQANNYSSNDFLSWIGDWRNQSNLEFRNAIYEALPNRTKTAVRKFCQRRYVPKMSGPWTPEEDEQLLKAHAELGEQWEQVRLYLDLRSAQQCRDRWRNHLQYQGKLVVGPWSVEEERQLISAVYECLEFIESERVARGELVNPPDELEKLINWDTVSNNMGGRRGRKRCMEKWFALKRRNNGEFPPSTLRVADRSDDNKENTEPQVTFNEQSKSQRFASKQFAKFETGDIYDVLVEISTAVVDHTLTFREESTLWSTVALRSKNSRFTSALRRRAYHYALEIYGGKKAVKNVKTIAAKAEAMVQWLKKYAAKNKSTVEEFPRGFQPGSKRTKKLKDDQQMLSKERVENSDDEDEISAEAVKPRQASVPTMTETAPNSAPTEATQVSRPRFKKGTQPQAAIEEIEDSSQDRQPKKKKKKRKSKEVYVGEHSVPTEDPPAYEDVVEVPETQEAVLSGADDTAEPAAASAFDDALMASSLPSPSLPRTSQVNMGRTEFLARCRKAGRSLHAS